MLVVVRVVAVCVRVAVLVEVAVVDVVCPVASDSGKLSPKPSLPFGARPLERREKYFQR